MTKEEHALQLRSQGITKLPGLISEPTAIAIREKINHYREAAMADPEIAANVARRKRHRIGCLLERDTVFTEMLLDDAVLSVCKQLLTENLLCSSWSSHTLLPGFQSIAWHRDYPHWSDCSVGGQVLALQVFWLLDEFRRDNGATQFLPTSHMVEMTPAIDACIDHGLTMTGSPGDVFITDARVFHTSMPNTSVKPRTCLIGSYIQSFVLPMEDIRGQVKDAALTEQRLHRLCHGGVRQPVNIRF